MQSAFPANPGDTSELDAPEDPYSITLSFNDGGRVSPFGDADVMQGFRVLTAGLTEAYDGTRETLGDVLVSEDAVPPSFYLDDASLPRWEYLKGSKHEPRVASNGREYVYSEGAMSFPRPARQAEPDHPDGRGRHELVQVQARRGGR